MKALACLLLFAAAATAHAQGVTYSLDPVHTRVMFAVSHAGFSNPMGTVSGTTGSFEFDPANWASARVEAKIPLARLELGDAKWNEAALGRSFLDAKQFPTITFVSTQVTPVDATHAKVKGNLTLRGVTRQVELDVVFHQAKRHPLPPFRYTAGFSATTTISRKAFAITSWPSVVGDSVEIRIEAEGTRTREDMAPAAASTQVMPPGTSTVAPASDTVTPSTPR